MKIKKYKDYISGGLADKMNISDIAKKHNIPTKDLNKQLAKGIKVEMEHTNDPKQAEEIALDHLYEFPDYYDRLEKIEK
jgi:hypothetical protein